jgi:phage terminase large subunit GpA-like protein
MTLPISFSLERLLVEAAQAVRPATRMTVAESAEAFRYINMPGSYVGPWKNDTTPYLVEPMEVLSSLDFTGMIFVGPAQTGKTDMFLNWVLHSVKNDPADLMLVQTSRTTARDFSMRRIDRLHRNNPDVNALVAKDNTYDVHYRSGMLLTLSWPAINELSGKPIPRLWLTDYDRMPQDVDGEGNPFDLARKRATTFRRHGMTVAESSPGFMVDNPKWVRRSKHEAEPTQGILSLYNRGDRRRWYWRCVSCEMAFEPDFELLVYPESHDIMESAEEAHLCCPNCGQVYHHESRNGIPGKVEMNINGRWVKDGMVWTPENTFTGTPSRSTIASFWVKGVAAAFTDWKALVFNYLSAEQDYASSGSEEALKATVNTDQGKPYTPKQMASDRVPEQLKARAKPLGQQEVPPQVRFLVACIDVQKNRFVVQVHGIAANGDIYVIDRFDIRKSMRIDPDGERFWVNPAAYPEDWKLLTNEVMLRTYPLADGSGRHMAIKFTVCDSGGKDGVTSNAYDFFRWLRRGEDDEVNEDKEQGEYQWSPDLAGRFLLLKGASFPNAPRFTISFPDSQRKDRKAGARGEIPVGMVNPNILKDSLSNRLDRQEPGGMIVFPDWLPDTFYIELTVEVRDSVKGWINPKRYRNESWDLLVYCLAALLAPGIAFDSLDFTDPPSWAEEWDVNDLVFDSATSAKPFDAEKKSNYSLANLASALA